MSTITALSRSNYKAIATLAFKMWPDSSLEEETRYFQKCIDDPKLMAYHLTVEYKSAGFVLVSLRSDFVEGTATSPVCYVEGVYVEPEFRRKGLAELLIQQAEEWGKAMHCTEIASDAEIGNQASIALHKGLGFREANRVVCFAKKIN